MGSVNVPGVIYQEPDGIDVGQTTGPFGAHSRRGSAGDPHPGPFHPGPAPSRSYTNESTGNGPSVLNGASRFMIDNLNSTIIGTNNVHGQLERGNLWATAEGVFYDMITERKNELNLREQELDKREAHLQEQARLVAEQRLSIEELMAEQRRSNEEQEKSLEGRRQALEKQKKTVEEQERTLVQLARRLKTLEEDLRAAEHPMKPGGAPRLTSNARGGVARYMTPRLRAAFGECATGIEELARQFDFTTIELAGGDQPSFNISFAPHYCGLSKEQIEGFPESLKAAILSVVAQVEAARRADTRFTWPMLSELLTTNEHLKASAGTAKRFNEGPIWLKENLKPADLADLNEWLQRLFTDGDFLAASPCLAKVKKKSTQELPNQSYDTKSLMDLLVLWFPVEDRRSFRLSQTTLKLCSTPRQGGFNIGLGKPKTRHFLFADHQTSCIFHPRETTVWKMDTGERTAMVQDALMLIDD